MARLAGLLKRLTERLTERLTVQQIAAVLIIVGVVVGVVGVVSQYCICTGWPGLGDTLSHIIGDYYANVSVDCLSVAFAILVIDRLNERRAERDEQAKLKAQFIREMGSIDNGIALRAVGELRARGWLEDGSLRGANLNRANLYKAELIFADLQGAFLTDANLQGANLMDANLSEAVMMSTNLQGASLSITNLQGANLIQADLRKARLTGANLRGVNLQLARLQEAVLTEANLQEVDKLTDWQLMSAFALRGATMPAGTRYDSRYNLSGDILTARNHGIRPDNLEQMAQFYGLSLEDYLRGQEWARTILPALRRIAKLDPAGNRVHPSNALPQPAAAPVQSAPRRNNHRHKASIVAHRTRR
jgi:uncharacterized protein YjbI with pentapeptide repeats